MPRDLSPTKFLLLVIAVEFSLEYRGLLWNAPNSKPATMRFLLRSLQNPSPPHSLTPLDPLTILAQLDAIPIIANPPASLKTILLFQLEKIYALSNLDAVFDVAQAAVEGMVGGYVGLGVDQGLQNILSLSRASELGIFVRKMVLDYRTFNFDESVRFFEAVMRLRDALLSNDGAYISVTEVVTQSDADRYVDFYARYAGCTGVTLPKELAHNLMRIQEAAPDSVKVYYVQYLAAMKAENFTVALEKLHQFYDYSAVHSDKPMRQYAALDLAVLHATFAQIDKACQILDEAISVSRVLKDAECLNYCLSWAYKLQSIGGHLDGLPHDPAAHIHSHVLQSTFLAMPQLQRVGEIELARASVEKGRDKVNVLEALRRARLVTQGIDAGLLDESVAVALAHTEAWNQYGNTVVADLHSLVDDALMETEVGPRSDDAIVLLCLKAEKLWMSGQREDAAQHLEHAQRLAETASFTALRPFTHLKAKLAFYEAVYSNASASHLLQAYSDLTEASSFNEDWRIETEYLRSQMLVRLGRPDEATDCLSKLVVSICKQDKNSMSIQCLIGLADIYLTQNAPHAALPLILSSISLASDSGYSQASRHRIALVHLTRFFLAVGMPDKASETVDSVLGSILVHGNSMDRGIAEYVKAETIALKLLSCGSRNARDVHAAVARYDAAYEAYQSVHCVDSMRRTLYAKAQLLHALGDGFVEARNEAARQFRNLDSQN